MDAVNLNRDQKKSKIKVPFLTIAISASLKYLTEFSEFHR